MTAPRGETKAFGLIAADLAGNKLSRKTKALLERGDNPRTGQPVWRNSYYEGQCEDRIWRRIGDGSKRTGKRLHGLIMKSARRLERETRTARKQLAERCRRMSAEEREEAVQRKQPILHHARRGLLGEVGLEATDERRDLGEVRDDRRCG